MGKIEIEKLAQEYADATFKTPLNSKGEEMVQRVGQNPYGYKKHCLNVKKHFIAGFEMSLKIKK